VGKGTKFSERIIWRTLQDFKKLEVKESSFSMPGKTYKVLKHERHRRF
jgi:hypothetical protein